MTDPNAATGGGTDAHATSANAAHKEKVALSSIAASAGIMLAKLIAGLLSGSLALISEAAHALVDTGATVVTYLAVRTANKPPDEDHQYGHGKFESMAALAETVVLFILATVVVMHAWDRLRSGGGDFEPTVLAFAVLIISIVVDVNRVRVLRKVSKETGSQALAADAIHFASDLIGSVLVLLGLATALAGFRYGDALAAMGVAAFIALAGWQLGRQTIDTLLDRAPAGASSELTRIVAAVPGVVEVEQLRLRPGGTHLFGDVTVVVSRTLPLDRVVQLKNRIIGDVQAAMPDVSLNVTSVPRALDDETVLERVLLTAAKIRIPVHHVTVQSIDQRLSVSLDLEVDGRMSLGAAHAKASKLEAAIRDELGPNAEVETHIEPLVVKQLAGQDASAEVTSSVTAAILKAGAQIAGIDGLHDIRVRQTEGGLVVNYHCRFDPAAKVADVHQAVDELDRIVRGMVPGVVRITSHAEPQAAQSKA